MRIARGYGEIVVSIFSRTRTVLLSRWLQQARHRPADTGLRGRRLKTSRRRQP
jgi:hypothetical protein